MQQRTEAKNNSQNRDRSRELIRKEATLKVELTLLEKVQKELKIKEKFSKQS
jgi:hypothetical protein